jgi:hypothetical protein
MISINLNLGLAEAKVRSMVYRGREWNYQGIIHVQHAVIHF